MVELYNIRFFNEPEPLRYRGHGMPSGGGNTSTRSTTSCGWRWPRRLTLRPTGRHSHHRIQVGSDSYGALSLAMPPGLGGLKPSRGCR